MLLDDPISKIAQSIRDHKVSPTELVQEAYSQIELLNSKLNAFITLVDKESVLNNAKKVESLTSENQSILAGIPFAIKDSYVTKDIRTTAASKVLDSYIPQYNATVYQKLLESNALLIGKTNMDSWGHGATGENTDYGAVKNPYDIKRAAGGSTAGSAVANACRMSSFAIGEDTGGSIRLPSSWTNTCGLKVTYGRVSRYGCISYASSFDTVGPMAKYVEDIAHVLFAIAGVDSYDATSSPHKVDNYPQLLNQTLKDLTLGIPHSSFGELDEEIYQSIRQAEKDLAKLGIKTVDIDLSKLDNALASYTLISRSETSSNLARYDGIRYGGGRELFTPETSRRIIEGSYALSSGYYDAYYRQAQKVRTLIIQEYEQSFNKCDCMLFPVTPTPPTTLGQVISDPVTNILYDYYNCTQNPAGVPSLALPCGFTNSGLPIGMQLTGPIFTESLLLAIGYQYQKITKWHQEKPTI